jgi:hypothetical protein
MFSPPIIRSALWRRISQKQKSFFIVLAKSFDRKG